MDFKKNYCQHGLAAMLADEKQFIFLSLLCIGSGRKEFYLAFVYNFKFLFINWALVPAGQAMKASTAASPNVGCNSSLILADHN